MLPILALDAVTSIGPGAATDLGTVTSRISAYVLLQDVSNSYPGTQNQDLYAQVNIEGSFDNENWFVLSEWGGGSPIQTFIEGPISGEQFAETLGEGSMGARYVRANWVSLSAIAGYPTTGTLSVWIGVELPPAGPASATFNY